MEEKNSALVILYKTRHILKGEDPCKMIGIIGLIAPKQAGNKFPSMHVTII